jgi:hypothetical protein
MKDPINEKEVQIKNQLMENGVDGDDIQFRSYPNESRYIRIGYWKPLRPEDLKGIETLSEDYYEDYDGDDHRGRPIIRGLYSYNIK